MVGLVIAFSGAIGSGKSSVTKQLANKLGYFRVSFGEHVRDVADSEGLDSTDRAVLQEIGQRLVQTDLAHFVRDVLARVKWQETGRLIIDGLRHVEVLQELRRQVAPDVLKLIHISVDENERQERLTLRKGLDAHLAYKYDQHITESQIRDIIPNYADIIVDGNQPLAEVVSDVEHFVQSAVAAPVTALASTA